MNKILPDTNLILRYLVGDVPEQMEEAKKIFMSAEAGKIKVILLPIIIGEVCYVLANFYHKSFQEIANLMKDFLSPSWWKIEHRDALRGMWEWYGDGLHFVDSYLLALHRYEGIEIISFDKKLMKKRGI